MWHNKDINTRGGGALSELFFSERLEARLSLLRRSALTVVEAPAGYGKTTALHRALQGVDRDSQCWYTAAAGERDGSFLWFLRHVETVDPDAAARIRSFGPLNRSNAAAIADILAGLAPEKPLYIVIDNFQLVAGEWQPQLLRGLASMKPGGLRLILAGQSFGRLRPTVEALGSGLCYIGVRELALSRDDMGRFAEMLGLEPNAAQIDRAWSQTRGWTAAVALYLENLMVRGRAQFSASDVDGLLNRLFWSGLPCAFDGGAVELRASDNGTEIVFSTTSTWSLFYNGSLSVTEESGAAIKNSAKVENVSHPASFTVKKTDGEGNPLKGAVFTLYDRENQAVAEKRTGDDGLAAFGPFSAAGSYTLKETRPPQDRR